MNDKNTKNILNQKESKTTDCRLWLIWAKFLSELYYKSCQSLSFQIDTKDSLLHSFKQHNKEIFDMNSL